MSTGLDASAPLVQALLAIMDGRGSYHHAIDLLVAAERRHRIRIIHGPAAGSLASTWVPRDPRHRPTIREVRAALAQHAADAAVIDQPEPTLYRIGTDDDTPDQVLFPFLTETSLLLCGTDVHGDHCIEFPDGALASWSPRGWGNLLFGWAQATGWRPRRELAWADRGGLFFAYDLHEEIDRYADWCTAVRALIRRKCERLLDEPADDPLRREEAQ